MRLLESFYIYESIDGKRYYLCGSCLDQIGGEYIMKKEGGKDVRKK